MKVWVISRGYPTEQNQMLGSFELEQAKMLSRAGCEVYYPVVDLRSIRRWRRFGLDWKKEDGVYVSYLNLPIGRLINKNMRERLYLKVFSKLERTIEKKHGLPDIIHIHYPSFLPYFLFEEFQNKGVKIVVTEHWTEVFEKTLPEKNKKYLIDYVKRADEVCCVGSGLKRSIMELSGTNRRINIVPNVVNNIFSAKPASHEGFRFIAIGRLVPVKQFDQVVKAFAHVFGGNTAVSLTIVGDGEERDKIKNEIIKNNVQSQVKMTGEVSREKTAELLASSDVLIVFSRLETFCVPVIEAWACGKPVTTTTTTVFADNPDHRLGIMVDWNSIETLESALQTIFDQYNDYDSKWIENYAREHFSEEVVSNILLDLYNNIIN